MNSRYAQLSILIISGFLFSPKCLADNDILDKTYLFKWDQGIGTNFPNWTYSEDVNGFGASGWTLTEHLADHPDWDLTLLFGGGPRSLNKTDYGRENFAQINPDDRAPGSTEGGSLIISETPESTDHRSTWWVWYDGVGLGERGITNTGTNRMSFFLKTTGMTELPKTGARAAIKTNFHIGTYLCWSGEGIVDNPGSGTGRGCPFEGPGNQHYYHYLAIDPGAWIHVLLDTHPQHLRGVGPIDNNPTLISDGKSYFEYMHQFYMEIRAQQPSPTSMSIDEIFFYNTVDTSEPDQNDESITSLWVGYWHNEGEWRLGFQDESYDSYNDSTNSTYEIRWSTSPITNSNYEEAHLVNPALYSGPAYTGTPENVSFRRAQGWDREAFTTFNIPREEMFGANTVYFAVKDISSAGENRGSTWPWVIGDGHDAPNQKVKVISYPSPLPHPKPPSELSISAN